jgi:hypothetical protein
VGAKDSRLTGFCRPWTGVALLLALALSADAPRAEVRWRSGATSAPAPMAPAELARAVADLAASPAARRIVVHLDGPLTIERREELEARGLRLLSYLGGHAYFATLAANVDAGRLAAAPELRAVEAIDPANKLHPDLARGVTHPWAIVAGAGPERRVAVYVLFHRDVDVERDAETIVRRHGGQVASWMRSIDGLVAHLPEHRVAGLAAEDAVMWVEPPLPALQGLNDGARAATGADVVNAAPYDLDGSGVSVLVYDAGKVFAHDDLAGRVTVGQSDTSGIDDHATHVACTVGGDGGNLSGMAPAVEIISYGFEQEGGLSEGFLYTDPGDLEADYGEAVSLYGADLSNNSIGTNTASNGFPCDWEGNYGATSVLIDQVVRGGLGGPFRVVWANGNERGSGTCGTTYHTTAPPACAKNHVTVGALNSNNDSVTSFTSWGPCDDGRLKPDVSAPGCQSGGDNGLTSCSAGGGYGVKCGTSMASPTTAGVSALLLQQFRESFPARPDFRNSLLRAILAQTAVDLGNAGPDYQTGYGSIRAQPAADLIISERFVEDEVVQGQVYVFTMDVAAGNEVEVTLAWDDPPGTPDVNPILVNDLDLRIVGPPGQTVYLPWTLNPASPGSPAVKTVKDSVNNIEQVRISNAPAGTYTVEIEGFNVAEGPTQPFSVATSHDPVFCTEVPSFGGVVDVAPGDSCGEIDLSWSPGTSNCSPPGEITYDIYRSTLPFFLPIQPWLIRAGHVGTTFTDFALEPGVTYRYIVRAVDSQSGSDNNVVRKGAAPPATPDIGPPAFDGLATVVPGPSCGEIVLDWPAAIETCSGPVVYDVHGSTDPGFVPGPATLLASTFSTDFVDTSVPQGTTRTYLVRARDNAGNADANEDRLAAAPTAFDIVHVQTAFEPTNAGWSAIDPNDADTGLWEWGDPQPTSYQPGNDASNPGVNCWITGLAPDPGNNDVDAGSTTLLSARYDLSSALDPTVEYQRWFTNDQGGSPGDPTDSLRVDVSNDDGQTWSPLEEVGPGTPLAWVPVSLDIPIAVTSQMRFRFSAADLGAGSLVEAGIDEFSLIDAGAACLVCSPPPAQTLCSIHVTRSGDDVVVDWSANPVPNRAVVYRVNGCDPVDSVRIGTATGTSFVHENAALSPESFNYRVTTVDDCGNEVPFCGATDCP